LKIAEVCAIDTTVKSLLLPLIKGLISNGYEVEVICSPGSFTRGSRSEKYDIHEINIDRKIGLSNIASIYRLVKCFKKEKYDIVHVHTPVAAVLGRIAARIARIPLIVYTAHGFYFHENMPRIKQTLFVFIEKIIARTCTDAIFTQSLEDYNFAIKAGIVGKKGIWHISNGIDLSRFDPELVTDTANQNRKGFCLSPDAPVISFIGRMVEEKGILDLMEAFCIVNQEIPEATLLLIGDTLESDRDQLVKQKISRIISENQLADKVFFCGFRDDIPELLSISNIFVLPSYREGMPRSIIEAMAMGKPVVATKIRGCREEVVNGKTGLLVPVASPEILAKAIITILLDYELAQKMGRCARERALEEFDEGKVIAEQLIVLSQLLRESAL